MSMLAGKVVVVTGMTSGIGEALATRLVEAGCTVVGIARSEEKLAKAAVRLGANLVPVVCDLAEPLQRSEVIGSLLSRFQRIDVLVNNAAEVVYETPTSLPVEHWRRLLELNTLAAIELATSLAPRMPEGAQVVNTSSVTARFLPNAKFAPYALTKVALEHFTDALRQELDPRGVKVTLVVPGLVDTPIYDKVEGFDSSKKRIQQQVPTWLSADDVAEAILWTIDRPAHVVVSELVIMPRGQAR